MHSGQTAESGWPCGWVTGEVIPPPEGAGSLGRANQKLWKMVERGRLKGLGSCEAILILHILEDKYYISPPAASSQSALPKCSVLPIFKSLELLNASLFTHFSCSQWVIYGMTWPLALEGDDFKSTLARRTRETKRNRTNCMTFLRLPRPSSTNKNCPVGKKCTLLMCKVICPINEFACTLTKCLLGLKNHGQKCMRSCNLRLSLKCTDLFAFSVDVFQIFH